MRPLIALLALLALPACGAATCTSPEAPPAPTTTAPLATKAAEDAGPAARIDTPRRAIYSSRDVGQTWTPIDGDGPFPEDVQVTFMEPWGTRLVVGTEHHGLFIGDPIEQSWAHAGDGLPGAKITAVHIAGQDLYVGVYKKGIFVSHDSGRTWGSRNYDLEDLRVRAILSVGPELLVGTDTGIFTSRDGQSMWQKVFAEAQVVSLNRDGSAIVGGAASGTVLSADGGERWSWIHKEGAAHNTAIIGHRIVLMNISGDIYMSGDWGRSWDAPSYGPREASYVYEMVAAGDQLVASNNYGIHRSDDGGERWQHVYKTEELIFIDLVTINGVIYGGTREWGERRAKIY
jgi:photosystem II stability/assembly factor-like uncharacterized protein